MSILLQGETGAGKEVFARELHARSKRAAGPFVAVNCAALPESLIESELFGYEDGAFTGARRQGSKGLLRQAHGGVLFLDEIGDMPLLLQSRLLRVLQTREVSPLGAARPVPVDFALVCATHRPLAHADADTQGVDTPVRPDLYFRIAEYTVTLAPLRARADRLELLRGLWAAQGAGPRLPPDIEAVLLAYSWPGNYRQMAAVLRTLHVLAGPAGRVDADMLPADIRATPAPAPGAAGDSVNLQAMTDAAIRDALAAHGGNVSRAARALGVHRSTLYRRMNA
ncbi:sigma-54-dependent Fis family transcriptional regulator [Achromobacter pulmonis]|uniref:sigma-54-dependent Fis family transcriptional regulator n=1 Tax=Achromobacter pulmonis TaxID=1389932 RepID=UPI00215A0946|nr:sigma 54-interacting transcriptional regulator [Achromobacter pulmonis]